MKCLLLLLLLLLLLPDYSLLKECYMYTIKGLLCSGLTISLTWQAIWLNNVAIGGKENCHTIKKNNCLRPCCCLILVTHTLTHYPVVVVVVFLSSPIGRLFRIHYHHLHIHTHKHTNTQTPILGVNHISIVNHHIYAFFPSQMYSTPFHRKDVYSFFEQSHHFGFDYGSVNVK